MLLLSVIFYLSFFFSSFFFFNDTATTEIYTLSLHDALPISSLFGRGMFESFAAAPTEVNSAVAYGRAWRPWRSEEHTSELQSRSDLVCRLLLEKKKTASYADHPWQLDERDHKPAVQANAAAI